MPIIKPAGLLGGERIAQLSDVAKLYWPFLYSGANGYGRFEVSYPKIVANCFPHFNEKPSRELILGLIKEYREKHLLFLYETSKGMWAAWDSTVKQQYYSREDKASPAPDQEAFERWRSFYYDKKAQRNNQAVVDSLADELRRLDGDVPVEASSTPETEGSSINKEDLSSYEEESVFCKEDLLSLKKSDLRNEESVFTNNRPSIHQLSNTSITSTTSKASETTTSSTTPPISLMGIEGWDKLIEAAGKANMILDPDPGGDLCQKTWRWLSMEDKLAAVRGITARIENGQYGDPKFTPKLRRYLEQKLWTESLRSSSNTSLMNPGGKGAQLLAERKRRLALEGEKASTSSGAGKPKTPETPRSLSLLRAS
jgi:hypothetical protein